MKINTWAVNCNDAWPNTEGDDISGSYVKYKDHQEVVAALEAKRAALAAENEVLKSCVDGWCDMPVTDAFLAEVRAQGVDSSIETIMIHLNHQYQPIASAIHFLKIHAAQLRQEVAQ